MSTSAGTISKVLNLRTDPHTELTPCALLDKLRRMRRPPRPKKADEAAEARKRKAAEAEEAEELQRKKNALIEIEWRQFGATLDCERRIAHRPMFRKSKMIKDAE